MKALQNGSDIRGIAITTETETMNLGPEQAKTIATGIVNWLAEEKGLQAKVEAGTLKIAIGRDSRLSGNMLKDSLIERFVEQGVKVIDVGLATTPAMFMATQFADYQCDAGLMITASHLPYYFNGIKLFTKTGGAEKTDIAYILSHIEPQFTGAGSVIQRELIPEYAADLVAKVRRGIGGTTEQPLAGMHIIVDAGNGAGGFFPELVLEPLGADTTGSQFLDPDGHFPNHIPNPDNKEAMASIRQAVLDTGADLGVIFDTDVDRSAVVDKNGNVLNRNNLIAVLATIVLAETPGASIVTNSPTSSHLKDFIESKGGKQVRYISGYRNVINKAVDLNAAGVETPLAIETSGHAAFKENYFLDDGAYVIAKLLMLLPKLESGVTLADLIATLDQPAEAQEVRFLIQAEDVRSYGEQVIADMEKFAAETPGFTLDSENYEGIRVSVSEPYGSGWFLLRMSLHEPLLVLQVENDVIGFNKQVFTLLSSFFKGYSELNLEKLTAILQD